MLKSLYQPNQEEADLSALMVEYAPLVRRLAEQVRQKNPSVLDIDDLIQSGIVGLLHARQTYRDDRGASFKTYAVTQIRFAIFDWLRKQSGITRDVSQYIKKIRAAVSHIEQTKTIVKNTDIADALGVSEAKYTNMVEEINAYKTVSTEEFSPDGTFATARVENPMFQALQGELRSGVKEVITALPQREQLILALYYTEFLNLKEIGDVLGLTEARVSQLHRQLLEKLKLRMAQFEDTLGDDVW